MYVSFVFLCLKPDIHYIIYTGLDKMREVQNPEAGEMYNCFLCGACLPSMEVVPHILSLKHRKKYLVSITIINEIFTCEYINMNLNNLS